MTPSGAVADDAEAGRRRLHRLVMPAVHFARVRSSRRSRISRASSESLSIQTSCASVYGSCSAAPSDCAAARRRPATGCPAPACRRTRRSAPGCRGRCAKIGRSRARAAGTSAISNSSRPGSASTTRRVRRLAVPRRRDVVAAGEQQAVDAVERLARRQSTDRRCGPRRRRGGSTAGSPRACGTR